MRKLLYSMVLIFTVVPICLSQTTYFKQVQLFGHDYSGVRSIAIDSMDVYFTGNTLCIDNEVDSFNCLYIARLDEYGEQIWGKSYQWSRASNRRAITVREDTIFLSGHIRPGETNQVYNFVMLTTDGDSLSSRAFDYPTDSLGGVFNNGLTLVGDEVYLYGQTATAVEKISSCVVQKYNYKNGEEKLFLYRPEFGEYDPGWDLAHSLTV